MSWIQWSGIVVMVVGALVAFYILDFKPWLHRRRETRNSSDGKQGSPDQLAIKSLKDEMRSWHEGNPRKRFVIEFEERETLPDLMQEVADDLGITVEQLIKRFITSGMRGYQNDDGPAVPGETLEDFFVKNGVLKERK